MAPLLIFLLTWTSIPLSVTRSEKATPRVEPAPVIELKNPNDLAPNKNSDKKLNTVRKRLTDPLIDGSLLQAGILIKEYGLPDLQVYQQNNEGHFQLSETTHAHQGEINLASWHPTKPVYHYTPLPPGTFPTPSQQRDNTEEDSSDSSNYWMDYLVRDSHQGLHMGQKEMKQGDLVRGTYHVLLPDHRTQVVNYWSDWSGFHPTITYT